MSTETVAINVNKKAIRYLKCHKLLQVTKKTVLRYMDRKSFVKRFCGLVLGHRWQRLIGVKKSGHQLNPFISQLSPLSGMSI
ncbi:hypothetical protein YC2023_119121 [Brassica napus]